MSSPTRRQHQQHRRGSDNGSGSSANTSEPRPGAVSHGSTTATSYPPTAPLPRTAGFYQSPAPSNRGTTPGTPIDSPARSSGFQTPAFGAPTGSGEQGPSSGSPPATLRAAPSRLQVARARLNTLLSTGPVVAMANSINGGATGIASFMDTTFGTAGNPQGEALRTLFFIGGPVTLANAFINPNDPYIIRLFKLSTAASTGLCAKFAVEERHATGAIPVCLTLAALALSDHVLVATYTAGASTVAVLGVEWLLRVRQANQRDRLQREMWQVLANRLNQILQEGVAPNEEGDEA